VKLTNLGNGTGASSTLVEIAGHRVLVDCGNRQSGDTRPFLSRTDELSGVEAILLTNADMDHLGALPVVYPLRRDIPIYMTEGVLDIVTTLLKKASHYSEAAVERCLAAVCPVPDLAPVELFGDDVRATFYPAGHTLGATSIVLESPDGVVIFSSAGALADQRTNPGTMIPHDLRPDAVVVELSGGKGTYGIDGHADASEVARILRALEPENAVFVHGDDESRHAIASAAQLYGVERSHLPGAGDEVDVLPKRRRRSPPGGRESRRAASRARVPLDEVSLAELASMLVTRDGPHAWYTIDDLLKAWGTPGFVGDLEERNRVRGLLADAGSPFMRDRKRVFVWRVRTNATGDVVGGVESNWRTRVRQRMEETAARQHAKTLFPEDSGLYQVSAYARTYSLVLAFDFPNAARKRYAAQLDRVAAETGWAVKVRDEPHQGALADAALAALPEGVRTVKQPSIFLDDRAVAVRVEGEPATPDAFERAADAFRERTGFALRFEASKKSATPPLPPCVGETGKLDQSSAQQRARAAFPAEAGLYRVSALAESTTLILAFHFPDTIRARFPEGFERVAAETGWTVTVREEPNLGALSDAADAAVPEGLRALKRPSVRHDLRKVTVRVDGSSRPDLVEASAMAFRELTGYELHFEWAS
jgi:predicted metal-dependent RNase